MSTKNVYDGRSNRIGYVNEMSSVSYGHDINGKKVGYYDKNSNTTFDANGIRYGKGNVLESLIFNAKK